MIYLILIIVAILLVLYGKYIYNNYGNSIPFILIFFIYAAWALVSIIYIDGGTYIIEQDRTSTFTGSSLRFLIVMLPFFYFLPKVVSQSLQKKMKPVKNSFGRSLELKKCLTFIAYGVLIYLYLNLFISGIPMFNKQITNFNFYITYSKLPFASTIQAATINFFLLFFGVIFASNEPLKEKKKSFLYYLLLVIYRILFGEKFYPFLLYSFLFFLPTLMNFFKKAKNKGFFTKKTIIIAVSSFLILLGASLLKYTIDDNPKYKSPVDHLFSRIFSLQSHMFYGYDKYLMEHNLGWAPNFEELQKELVAGLKKTDKFDKNIGLTKIMVIISPKEIVDRYLNDKTRFYGGYWTLSIGCLGYVLTAFYSILVAAIIAYFSKVLAFAIKKKDYILLFLSTNCYYIFFTYFNEANYSFIFSYRMFLFTFLIIFYDKIMDSKVVLKISEALNEKLKIVNKVVGD